MSEGWDGWYQNEPQGGGAGSPGEPSYTPGYQGPGGPGTPNGPAGGGYRPQNAWPSQPPARSVPGGPLPGPRTGTGGTRRGWRRWVRPKRILLIVAALVVLLIVASVGLYFDLNSKLTRVPALVPTSLNTAGTNWLIAGSDSRGGLTKQQENELTLGHDITGGRSDTILILHVPSNGDRPTLVSIPRDSYVPIPGYGYNKINAAYSLGGPRLLTETVQNVTGLHINHYMGIGFGGLVDVVNDLGGVNLCLPAAYKDPKAGLNLKKGCQTLNGAQALAFVRTREFALGDLQREEDQRILIKAVLSKLTSAGTLVNPFAAIPAASGAAAALSVDQGTQLYQLVSVAFALRNPVSTTVPFGGFATTNVGSVVTWNTAEAKQFFNDLATDRPLPKDLISNTSLEGTA
ncbi:MAG: LCP family protein [Streptosporangiaceae bacterium]